jgi:hypothetical protein
VSSPHFNPWSAGTQTNVNGNLLRDSRYELNKVRFRFRRTNTRKIALNIVPTSFFYLNDSDWDCFERLWTKKIYKHTLWRTYTVDAKQTIHISVSHQMSTYRVRMRMVSPTWVIYIIMKHSNEWQRLKHKKQYVSLFLFRVKFRQRKTQRFAFVL